jgi:ATP-dependent DNA ligase
MGIGVRTIADLDRECRQYGLYVEPTKNSKPGKKCSKDDYILALRNHHLKLRYPDGRVPKHLQLILQMDSPMLANRFNAVSPEKQEEIWKTDLWGFQEKMDGVRLIRIFVRGEGLHFYSRGVSVKDYLPIEYTNIYQPNLNIEELGAQFDSYIADSELVCTNPVISTVMKKRGVETDTQLSAVTALLGLNDTDSLYIQKNENCPLKFYSFDCMFFNNEWLTEGSNRALGQCDREKVARVVTSVEKSAGLNVEFLETVYDVVGKKAFHDMIIAAKGEGVIAKHKNALYLAQESRARCQWIKIKRTVSGSLLDSPLNDTLDAFVSGWEPGEKGKAYENMVGTLKFSVWLVKPNGERVQHEIGHVSGLALDFRKSITVYMDDGLGGKVCGLHPDWEGRVAEIDGQNISSRAMRIRHCRLIAWRVDKNADQCELQENFLKEMVF